MEWNFFTITLTIFAVTGALIIPLVLSSKKEHKKRVILLDESINEQNKISGFVTSHVYEQSHEYKEDTYISLSTKEIIVSHLDKIYLGHFDNINNVSVETYAYQQSKYRFFLHLTFVDCKKISITIRDTDEMIYWHNMFKKIS